MTVSDDACAILWDLRTEQPVRRWKSAYPLLSGAVSPDADSAFVSGIDSQISCIDWSFDDTETVSTLRQASRRAIHYQLSQHVQPVTSLSVSPDGTRLASNSQDQIICLWDIQPFVTGGDSQRLVRTLTGHTHGTEQPLLRCNWSGDGRLVTSGSADGMAYVWSVIGSDAGRLKYKLPGHRGTVYEVAFHPKQPVLCSAGSDKKMFLGEI